MGGELDVKSEAEASVDADVALGPDCFDEDEDEAGLGDDAEALETVLLRSVGDGMLNGSMGLARKKACPTEWSTAAMGVEVPDVGLGPGSQPDTMGGTRALNIGLCVSR